LILSKPKKNQLPKRGFPEGSTVRHLLSNSCTYEGIGQITAKIRLRFSARASRLVVVVVKPAIYYTVLYADYTTALPLRRY